MMAVVLIASQLKRKHCSPQPHLDVRKRDARSRENEQRTRIYLHLRVEPDPKRSIASMAMTKNSPVVMKIGSVL